MSDPDITADTGARLAAYNESSRTIHVVSVEQGTHPVTNRSRNVSVCGSFTGSGGAYTKSSTLRLLPKRYAQSLSTIPDNAVVVDPSVLDGGGYIQDDREVLGKLCGNCCQQLDSFTDEA